MATVTEQVGEVLLGTTDEPQLSSVTRAAFMKHAHKDDASGEYYLNEDQFIDAVAPESEDYVSRRDCCAPMAMLTARLSSAQDQEIPVRHSLPGRRSR